MKKVGIMTLHIGDNYGALLQCYALRHCINELKGYKADIINYDPGREFPVYDDKKIQKKYLRKLEKFLEFNRCYNGVEGVAFTDINDSRTKGYDYYITGSDQVWNTSFVFSKEAYFLNFVPSSAKKIAYAASIGISTTSPKLKLDWFKNNLPTFSNISVREASCVDFIKQFTEKEVKAVVDPTLLLTREDYDELCSSVVYPKGDYVVLYFLKHDNMAPLLIEFTNMLSRQYNLKVVYSFVDVPGKVFKNESESFYYSDPREFIQLIRHAKAIVTNSFHGTVFALKYHIPFYTYLVGSMSSRVVDLLSETGMEERIVYGYKQVTEDMLTLDFSKADIVLGMKRNKSLQFLREALEVR